MPPKISSYFQLFCPTCSRPLKVLVRYLGQAVDCSHCGRCFIAIDTATNPWSERSALNRANQILACLPPDNAVHHADGNQLFEHAGNLSTLDQLKMRPAR